MDRINRINRILFQGLSQAVETPSPRTVSRRVGTNPS